jgi:hypothetical protein
VNPDEHHVALPKLYGAPAYARPPRVFEENERAPDPDDLPLEAFRDDNGIAIAAPALEPPVAEPPTQEPFGAAPSDDVSSADAMPGDAEPFSGPPADTAPGVAPAPRDVAESGEDAAASPTTGIASDEDAVDAVASPARSASPFSIRALGRFIQRR